MKPCPKCKTVLDESLFGKNSSRVDGLNYACRECTKIYAARTRIKCKEKVVASIKAWKERNKERTAETNAAWYAANKDRQKKTGKAYYEKNKARIAKMAKEWRLANPDKVAIYVKRHKKTSPEAKKIHHSNRREKVATGKLSKGLVEKLFKLQKGKCVCCLLPLGDDYHLDHIHPLHLGGLNVDSNMQLLRASCNMKKSYKHPVEYMQSKGFLL